MTMTNRAGSRAMPERGDLGEGGAGRVLAAVFVGTWLMLIPVLDRFDLGLAAMVVPVLIVAARADIVTHRVPDWASAGIAVAGLVRVLWLGGAAVWVHPLAALVVGGTLWGASELYFRRSGREGLGLGDVKFIAAAALLLGPVGVWAMILLAAMGGIVAILLTRQRGRALPFIPFLAFGLLLGWAVSSALY